jgi:hypothetical protein
MSWQNVGDENAEAAATATAPTAVTAPNPLTARATAVGGQRIIAVKLAMSI